VGGASFPALFVDNSGTVHASYQPALAGDLAIAPFSFFTLLVGAGIRLRGGDDRGFESFDPRLGLRFFPLGRFARSSARVELGVVAPLFGHDRTDVMVGLNAGWAWGAGEGVD